MIDLYTWTTPNAQKISIMLEEVGLPYRVRPIDIGKGEQHGADFLAVNPNAKVPAIVDDDGPHGHPLTLVESGAILIYLAEKTGMLLARDGSERAATLQWLMFQMSSIGPTFHDAYHFTALAAERTPHVIDYFTKECAKALDVLDTRLAATPFLANAYSIADIATYPWISAALSAHLPGIERFTNLARWHATISQRPPVTRGMTVPAN